MIIGRTEFCCPSPGAKPLEQAVIAHKSVKGQNELHGLTRLEQQSVDAVYDHVDDSRQARCHDRDAMRQRLTGNEREDLRDVAWSYQCIDVCKKRCQLRIVVLTVPLHVEAWDLGESALDLLLEPRLV